MKKLLLVIMSLVMIVGIFAACSKNDENPEPNVPNSSGNDGKAGEEAPSQPSYWDEKGTTISLYTYPWAKYEYPDDWPVYQWFKEDTNITIDPVIPAGDYKDSLSLTMASGSIPDVMYFRHYNDAVDYGTQGALINFLDHLDQMPNLKKYWEENPELKNGLTSPSGEIFLSGSSGLAYTNQEGWMYRADIFEKHGIEVPTNWDQLENVLEKLKSLYPTSYPLVWSRHVKNLGYHYAPTFGTGYDFYVDSRDKSVHYGPHSNEFKQMLGYMNNFYKKELIPLDWLTLTNNQWTELLTTDRSFITTHYLGRIDTLNKAFKEAGSDARMEWMAPPAGGSNGQPWTRDSARSWNGVAVYKNSKNLDAALKYVDYLYSDEGAVTASWGKEGVSYNEVNGKKQYIQNDVDITVLRETLGIQTYGAYGKVLSEAPQSLSANPEVYEKGTSTVWPYIYILPTWTEEENEVIQTLWVNLEGYREENYSEFILGTKPLDQFDEYVQRAYDSYQFERIEKVYTDGFKRIGLVD